MDLQFRKNTKQTYFFSQPHQPFFVLGFINAVVTMAVFALAYQKEIFLSISPISFHLYGLTYLLFTPLFLGFLFTTFPKFTSTKAIEQEVYLRVFGLFYLGAILFLLGTIVSAFLSAVGMGILWVGHFMGFLILINIYRNSHLNDIQDSFWMIVAMGFGVFSHLFFIFSTVFNAPLNFLAIEIAIYLYLFLLIFSVAQRMIPFFSHSFSEKNKTLLRDIFFLLAIHIVLDSLWLHSALIIDFILAYLIANKIRQWGFSFPEPNPLLFILQIGLYWIPVSFVLGGVTNLIAWIFDVNFLSLDIHVLMLGFAFTVLIGFATRVALGHSGNKMEADRWTQRLFYTTQVVVFLRIFISFAAALESNFSLLFTLSVVAWCFVFIVWMIKYFPLLITGKKLTS